MSKLRGKSGKQRRKALASRWNYPNRAERDSWDVNQRASKKSK